MDSDIYGDAAEDDLNNSIKLLRTPTKKRRLSDDCSSPILKHSATKFVKPSTTAQRRKRATTTSATKKSTTKTTVPVVAKQIFSPHKSPIRCKLPLETVTERKKEYSPLKFLQFLSQKNQQSNSNSSSSNTKSSGFSSITFSPLMKKLQRSPARSSISFPVVKRSGGGSSGKNSSNVTLKRQFNTNSFSRVLDFSEDANLPERPLPVLSGLNENSVTSKKNIKFHSLNAPNIDWAIKTKVRFITNRSVPFHGNFKPIDEATGLRNFVRGVGVGEANNTQILDNFAAELNRNCLVWQHPSIPWIKLFPRTPDRKPGSVLRSTTPVFTISPTGVIADELHSHFCESLHSLFKQLKSKHCPYFYLCANNFTILFRAAGVAGLSEAHALISPTTSGFRKLLDDEEISYQMPFHRQHLNKRSKSSQPNPCVVSLFPQDSSNSTNSSSGIGTSESSELNRSEVITNATTNDNPDDNPDEIDEDIENIEENDEWLESLGLSQDDFPSLDSCSMRRRRGMNSGQNGSKQQEMIDDQSAQGRMKSLVRIDGIGHCHTLLGLFINMRKICISNSGPLSGIPPTLLSPVPFHGATLKPIVVKQKVANEDDYCGSGSKSRPANASQMVSIDIVGPILPNTLYGLMNLFGRYCSSSSSGNLTVVRSSLRTYDQSSSFALEIGQRDNADTAGSSTATAKISNDENNPLSSLSVNPTFSVENLEECGLDRRFLTALCTPERQLSTPLIDFELTPNGIRYNRSIDQQGGCSRKNLQNKT